MSNELDKMIQENERKIKVLEQNNIKTHTIQKDKISKHITDHWKNLTNSEKLQFLNEFVQSITIINNDTNRHSGTAQIIDIKFYDYNI